MQGPTNPLNPPQRTDLPLWLALLLKRQRRANIFPPPWLHPDLLSDILELENKHFKDSFSSSPQFPTVKKSAGGGKEALYISTPFLPSCTSTAPATALPYHWLEMAEMLLDAASDDLVEPDAIRRLLRDLREVRMAKMRKGVDVLSGDGEGVRLDGVGAMEVAESRGFVTGVVDELRKLGMSREQARREREAEERETGYGGVGGSDEDEDMG